MAERDVEPLFENSVGDAVLAMGRVLHALRLEVPSVVADDVTNRWHDLLDVIEEWINVRTGHA